MRTFAQIFLISGIMCLTAYIFGHNNEYLLFGFIFGILGITLCAILDIKKTAE